MKILFVCTGNTCRSPMAEAYLNSKKLSGVHAISRGLAADGSPISENARLALLEKGIDKSEHISAQLTAEDIKSADKIICLSPSHKSFLLGHGVDQQRLSILGDGISDPFGEDLDIYKNTRDEIFAEIDKLIESELLSDVKIVPIDRHHIKQIAYLEQICFSEPWSEAVLLDAYKNGTVFFVAEVDGRFAGYLGINAVLDEGYITNVAVLPEYRQRGVATKLLRALFDFADQRGLAFVSLEVRVTNEPAISLYEKLGFSEEGRRRAFYRNPTEDALILTKRFNRNDENSCD